MSYYMQSLPRLSFLQNLVVTLFILCHSGGSDGIKWALEGGTGDGTLGGGVLRVGSSSSVKMDSFVPKPLESAVLLDVQNIACGGRHAALVTKQGEVFSWGEESGGRLGHACGEYHSCAVTLSGDLYTWGGGSYNFGLLGRGNDMSHWVPKRLIGPFGRNTRFIYILWTMAYSCCDLCWQLFTFGDGTFGVLGHGDCRSVPIPREVESLKGLRTVRAACGVWHTAAVVEVMVGSSSSSNCSSGKVFTWGDGDKGRLGMPNCCTYNYWTCLHNGSPVYGQLGDPQADGKLPTRIEGKLLKNFVEEIDCGAYHVAVLTSRTEVYTWGKGANGRLGHGDTDDRKHTISS
ncbi:PH, RCC1 and FYVE domains-containing protein 1 [Vitis vinifera]|uniref:PH, RCC1 and FYVE domains-containing protein 1 n=1 Tax=Vitis vinifera TaxID=29760 RepID=A0A438GPX1_VITVI|nr:PH, RCC1 and FYVE domains-containing protein 1 [Vitis vinifera]